MVCGERKGCWGTLVLSVTGPVVFPAEDRALDVVRVGDQPNREACSRAHPGSAEDAHTRVARAASSPSPYKCMELPLARSSKSALHSGVLIG